MIESSGSKQADRLPATYEEWEARARDTLSRDAFASVAGGAGFEDTIRANRESFYSWRIVPRVLRDVSRRSLRTKLFGKELPAPVVLAPAGSQKNLHPDGELGSARAAASLGLPFILSTYSSMPMEEVASVMGDAPRWFQLYPSRDSGIMKSFVQRAERSGYSAIVVTVDQAADYPRYRVGRRRMGNHANYRSDPVFRAMAKHRRDGSDGAGYMYEVSHTSAFTWEGVEYVRKVTGLPVILKGIFHPDDAKVAVRRKVDGIVVSNHGGRRLDGQAAALDMLPEISRIVRGRIPVLFDSGIRSGADILKAIALGADATMVGRAYLYGLAVAGERGVVQVINGLIAELDSALAICGCGSLRDLDATMVRRF